MRKIRFFTLSCFALLLAVLCVFTTVHYAFQPAALPISEKRVKAVSLQKEEGFTVLLMGTDKRDGDKGRTDTMILASVTKQSVQLISIPRDTRISIPGIGKEEKINHAYAYGGVELTAQTVESFFNIPVDYFVNINMEGFTDLIDELGGVTVHNPFAFTAEGTRFSEGTLTLSGEKALQFVRMRYDDPNGDFGRQERQQQMVSALLDKAVRLQHFPNLISAVQKNVETNLSAADMLFLQKNYGNARHEISVLPIEGKSTVIDGLSYFLVTKQEQNRLSSALRQHLGL